MKSEERSMKGEERSIKSEEQSMKSEGRSMKSEERSMKGEGRSMKSEEQSMKSEGQSEGRTVKRDLCERTFQFAVRIVKLCQELDRKPGAGRIIGNQLIRSGTSIGANVEEAQGGQSRADFVSKYAIARKEARETHYWLRLIVATEIFSYQKLESLLNECNELIAILTTIIKKTKGL